MAIIEIDQAASPFALPEAWDQITIAGQVWPPTSSGYRSAKFDIKGAKRAYKWEVQDGLGVQGAVEIYRGWTPQPFTIEFFLWDSALYAAWIQFQPLFAYNARKTVPIPIQLNHPMLQNLGISQVIVEDIGAIEMVDPSARMFSVTVSLREFFPPRAVAPATPDAASNGKPQDPNDDPVAVQLQAQLALLIPAAAAATGGVVPANPGVLPAPAPPFKP